MLPGRMQIPFHLTEVVIRCLRLTNIAGVRYLQLTKFLLSGVCNSQKFLLSGVCTRQQFLFSGVCTRQQFLLSGVCTWQQFQVSGVCTWQQFQVKWAIFAGCLSGSRDYSFFILGCPNCFFVCPKEVIYIYKYLINRFVSILFKTFTLIIEIQFSCNQKCTISDGP